MNKKRLIKEKKLSNVVHRLDEMSEIICCLDHKFPAEENILKLYEETLNLKKLIINNE